MDMVQIHSMQEVYDWGQEYPEYYDMNIFEASFEDAVLGEASMSRYSHEFLRDNANFICGVIDVDSEYSDERDGIAVITLDSTYYVVINYLAFNSFDFDSPDETSNILCIIPLDENNFLRDYMPYSSQICDLFLQHILNRDLSVEISRPPRRI